MISHKHKFIFCHINKTGGGSIGSKLRELHGFDREPEETKKVLRHNHILMRDHIDTCRVGGYNPDEYFKFAFVRNPWDRMVSFYYWHATKTHFRGLPWHKSPHGIPSFPEFIEACLTDPALEYRRSKPSHYWLVDESGHNICADFVGRFETLQDDFDLICDQIGFDRHTLGLVHKTDHPHYTDLYDDRTCRLVEEHFQPDIDHFGYAFGKCEP